MDPDFYVHLFRHHGPVLLHKSVSVRAGLRGGRDLVHGNCIRVLLGRDGAGQPDRLLVDRRLSTDHLDCVRQKLGRDEFQLQ